MTLIDSHCHLDFPELAAQREELLARAKEAGVGLMVTISTRVRRFDEIRAIAEAYPHIFCSVGTHPHNAGEETDVTAEELIALSAHPKVVAIGEVGLDYHYDDSLKVEQTASFRAHIAASRETGLPLIIHSRDADEDMATILEEESAKGAFPFVLHCFSSGPELAARGLALGGYISASGVMTFKNSQGLRDTFADVPLERLLVETDAPYLSPEPVRGKVNEPARVAHTAARLAEVKGVSAAKMAEITSDNFFRLFSKVPRQALSSDAA